MHQSRPRDRQILMSEQISRQILRHKQSISNTINRTLNSIPSQSFLHFQNFFNLSSSLFSNRPITIQSKHLIIPNRRKSSSSIRPLKSLSGPNFLITQGVSGHTRFKTNLLYIIMSLPKYFCIHKTNFLNFVHFMMGLILD